MLQPICTETYAQARVVVPIIRATEPPERFDVPLQLTPRWPTAFEVFCPYQGALTSL